MFSWAEPAPTRAGDARHHCRRCLRIRSQNCHWSRETSLFFPGHGAGPGCRRNRSHFSLLTSCTRSLGFALHVHRRDFLSFSTSSMARCLAMQSKQTRVGRLRALTFSNILVQMVGAPSLRIRRRCTGRHPWARSLLPCRDCTPGDANVSSRCPGWPLCAGTGCTV